jgi:hypothetical protein
LLFPENSKGVAKAISRLQTLTSRDDPSATKYTLSQAKNCATEDQDRRTESKNTLTASKSRLTAARNMCAPGRNATAVTCYLSQQAKTRFLLL